METTSQEFVKEIIDLIKRLPEADAHIHTFQGKQYVTNEWLCGGFAGRAFEGDSVEECTKHLITYLNEHKGHESIVGNCVDKSG